MRTRRKLNCQVAAAQSESRKSALRTKIIEIEKKLQASHRAQSDLEEKRAVERISTNSKYFYSYAKRFSSIKVGVGPLLDTASNLVTCPLKIGEMLATQYSSVFSTPKHSDTENKELFEKEPHHEDGLSYFEFSEADIAEAMGEFSPNSAAGPDNFPAMLLTQCKSSLAQPLHMIWSRSFKSGIVPMSCKLANIIPIHKGKSRAMAKNYRPVALTSLLVKTFEKVIRRRLVNYFDKYDMFNVNQHGFRASRSCLSQLLAHFDKVTSLLEEGKLVDVIYLDFAKAFDKVDIGITLRKLNTLGIHGSLGRWLHSFLSGRLQCVLVKGRKSLPRPVLSGVPQGSVLGPLLFLVLIGDIDKDIVSSFISSFADDTRVMQGISSASDLENLQHDLEAVYQWAADNNMKFNSDKFEHIRYSSTRNENPLPHSYTSNANTQIESKSHIRDLGVTMSDDATFTAYISEKVKAMKSKIGWILRTFQTRDRRPMLTLWKSLVLSEHDYCCQLWNPHRIGQIQSLDQVQYFFTRKIYGLATLSYWDHLKVLGLYSLERRRERYIAMYVWKILEGLVPNFGSSDCEIKAVWNPRRGRECIVPGISRKAPLRIQTIRRASFSLNGPRLFNSLPKYVRDTTNCEKTVFKARLDHYLKQVPDQPLIPGYTSYRQCESNSLIEWSRNAQLKQKLEDTTQAKPVSVAVGADHSDHSQ